MKAIELGQDGDEQDEVEKPLRQRGNGGGIDPRRPRQPPDCGVHQ